MSGTRRLSRVIFAAAVLAAAELAWLASVEWSTPAQAQFFGDSRSQQRPRSRGFFDSLFGPSTRQVYEPEPAQPVDNSRAPPPRKADAKADQVAPTTTVVVMGDSMADWLAYGLEDAFADAPEMAVVRKAKAHSGLLRYDSKNDLDWWHVARDTLAQEKATYVVMMLGVADRQNIRERDLAKAAEKKEQEKKAEGAAPAAATGPAKEQDDEASIVAPEPQQQPATRRAANGVIEFRTDRWSDIYSKRIDDTVAALKSKGVPVFWVGLPSVRGARSTADVVYLNDLYRARAERAGAIFVDVWDGFVDEAGKFTSFGPDFEGQVRRLRSADGVHFTKFGARKLAHYVERELRRAMSNRLPVALPMGPTGPLPDDGKPTARPLAGPVVPLTVTPANSDELAGGAGSKASPADTLAMRVLVKGEPVTPPPGRADDFAWQRTGEVQPASPVAAAAVPPVSAAVAPQLPSATSYTEPPSESAKPAAAKPAQQSEPAAKPKPQQTQRPAETRAQQGAAPRPSQPVAAARPQPAPPQRSGLFDFLR